MECVCLLSRYFKYREMTKFTAMDESIQACQSELVAAKGTCTEEQEATSCEVMLSDRDERGNILCRVLYLAQIWPNLNPSLTWLYLEPNRDRKLWNTDTCRRAPENPLAWITKQ